jgi:hypothetical protein
MVYEREVEQYSFLKYKLIIRFGNKIYDLTVIRGI